MRKRAWAGTARVLVVVGLAGGLLWLWLLAREDRGAAAQLPEPGKSNLFGIVTDSGTNLPLGVVAVRVEKETPVGEVPLPSIPPYTETDSSGFYKFGGLMPGVYIVHYEFLGEWANYEYKTVKINLRQGNNELNVKLVELELKPEFYMPSSMEISLWEHDILQWHYHQITYSVTITNRGNGSGTHLIKWRHFYNGNEFSSKQKQITLGPGESYKWSDKVDIDFSRCYKGTCKLYGDWPRNNYAEGIVIV